MDERKKIRNTSAPTPYLFNLPADYFELHFSPDQGPVLMLLPQVIKWNEELMRKDDALRTKFTRTMLARAAVMDVPVMKSHADNELCNRVERAQVRSGIADGASFHGPWEAASFVTGSGHQLRFGVYIKAKDRGLAMVVANTTAAAVRETITLNSTSLDAAGVHPGPKATLINAFTGAETSIPGEAPVQLELAPDDLQYIVWE